MLKASKEHFAHRLWQKKPYKIFFLIQNQWFAKLFFLVVHKFLIYLFYELFWNGHNDIINEKNEVDNVNMS
jgi:ATP/ADP translocase